MTFYQISYGLDDYPNRWWLGVPTTLDGRQVDVWAFSSGRRSNDSGLLFPIDEDGERLDFTWAPLDVPVLSPRAARVFEHLAATDVQLLPAQTPMGDNVIVLNILTIVDCIDYARSQMSRYENSYPRKDLVGKPQNVFRLAILPDRAKGHHVFRVKDYESAIIISAQILLALQDAGCTGLSVVGAVTQK